MFSTEDAVSPVSSSSPENFHQAVDPMARCHSQPREISNPELHSAPPVPKHDDRVEEQRSFSDRFPPVPTTEEKGKERAFLGTLKKPDLKLEGGKATISQLRKQLSQALKASAQLEDQVLKRTTDLSKLENQLYHNNKSLAETEGKLQASNLQCKILRMKLEDATEDLKQTQEHIFRLQPQQQGITQSDALAAYIAICDNVQSWIGFHLDGAFEEGHIEVGKLDRSSANKLINLLNPMGLKGTSFAETDEWNLIAIVMEFLRSEILERELYGAVELRDLDFLRTILKNMETLTPPRGTFTSLPNHLLR